AARDAVHTSPTRRPSALGRTLRHLAGAEPGPAPEHRHHPPLGHAERIALRVFLRDGVADPVRQHAEAVGQEMQRYSLGVTEWRRSEEHTSELQSREKLVC